LKKEKRDMRELMATPPNVGFKSPPAPLHLPLAFANAGILETMLMMKYH
jgi:hypothetical protein